MDGVEKYRVFFLPFNDVVIFWILVIFDIWFESKIVSIDDDDEWEKKIWTNFILIKLNS